MQAKPYHPKMDRRRPPGELPGWVLALVAVLVVIATAWTEGATPGAMATFFNIVGRILIVALGAVVIIALVGLWVIILAHCWRCLDDDTREGE